MDVGGEQFIEMTVGKTLGEVLASFGMSVFLVGEVPMMSKFVHEYVKQLERLRLPLSKAANTEVATDVVRHAKSSKKAEMRIDVTRGHRSPQVLVPCMKEYRAGLFAVIELVIAVVLTPCSQDDTLKASGEHGPVGDKIEKVLEVTLGDDVAITLPRRLPINNVTSERRGSAPVFSSCLAVDNLGRGSPIE